MSFQNESLRWLANHPFFAVRIITGRAKRIIGNHIIDQFLPAVIGDLMRFVRTEKKNIAELHIAKHRNGPTGMVELYFKSHLTQFANAAIREVTL